jgi:hypothetical protein
MSQSRRYGVKQVELIPTDEGDSTGVSLLPVGILYTVQGVN